MTNIRVIAPIKTPGRKRLSNTIIVLGDTAIIVATNMKRCVAGLGVIDTADIPLIADHRWFISAGYFSSISRIAGKRKLVKLHQVLLKPRRHQFIGFKNGCKLDNRRENLELLEGGRGASGYRNVIPSGNGWKAIAFHDKKRVYIGYFPKLSDAVEMADLAMLYYHGENANTNSPKEIYKGQEKQFPELLKELKRRRAEKTSIYHGVSYDKSRHMWRATTSIRSTSVYIGLFATEIEAAEAYDRYIIENKMTRTLNHV